MKIWNQTTDSFASFYAVLSVYLILSFAFLWYVLKRFSDNMDRRKKELLAILAIFAMTYVFKTIYMVIDS